MLYVCHRSVLPAPPFNTLHQRRGPNTDPQCTSLGAPILSQSPQGAELLARYGSDARTTGVVPLELGNCGHRKYPRSKAETQYSLAT
jgi:hypothetical protein